MNPVANTNRSFQKHFLGVLKANNDDCSKLIRVWPGATFYTCSGLHLQFNYGDVKAFPNVGGLKLQEKKRIAWGTKAGSIKQDSFGRLMAYCENLRREKPDVFR